MLSLYEQFTNMCRLYPNNKALVYYNSLHDQQVFTYTKMNKLSRIIWEWLEDYIETTTCIGMFLIDELLLVPVILGIHKGKCSFISLIGNESPETLKHVTTAANIKYLISTKSNIFPNIITISTLCVENNDLILWTIPDIKTIQHNNNNIAYVIKTSGSTGAPKLVFATHACINPNIEQLRNDFGVTSDDVIYMGTPATFDPFIVELYLAFTNGSCAIMVSKNLKYSDEILHILFKITPITFLQTTPSLFRLWHANLIKRHILSKSSALRILAFGGEVCPPLLELKQWKEEENKTRIFYLYGITEVSCWAMVREIKMNDMVDDLEGVYLGKPMIETTVEIRYENIKDTQPAIGELFIGSKTRKCIMEGESAEMSNQDFVFRATGDLVKWHDRKMYYICRMNDCIKRYGTKVNLYNIEKKINSFENVENCCCVWIAELGQLILFYKTYESISKDVFWHLIKSHLEEIEYPDFVHLIEDFPLSDHGKISKIKLQELFVKTLNHSDHISSRQYFFQELENLLPNIQKDISFLHSGGSSTTALIIVSKLEATTGHNFKKLVTMLLNDKISINECAKYVDEISKLQKQNPNKEVGHKLQSNSSVFNITIHWTYNLDKCVDATATLLDTYVSVGSHSHILATLETNTGSIISCMKLADRIESSVTFLSHDTAVVGCYDGLLYCFNPQNGKVKWTFKTGDMIKSKACYVEEKSVLFVTSYDQYLYSINSIDGALNWSVKICNKPLLATPCVSKNSLFCCSLGGTVAYIDILNASLKWSKKYNYPIFSSPSIIQESRNTTLYLFSEVDGTLHCINQNGSEVWKYSASGSIYSSFICYEKDLDTRLVIFGCHDKSIYCLEIRNNIHTSEPSLKWRCCLKSAIYATPNIITLQEKNFVIAASTIGQICIINFETGNILHDMKICGEIYSSPIVFEDKVYLGSRDNNLYCFKVSLNIS